jgi:nicotinamidase-related amidase
MNRIQLLVIDPQNDFMDIEGAALPVPGANADMERLAGFVQAMAPAIDDLIVTMDSHASVGIERTTFWVQADGEPVASFTAITSSDVEQNSFSPRNASLRPEVLAYLRELESGGERTLVVWPVHCVLGTWGHNLHGGLARAVAEWEFATSRTCHKVLKGLNPMTEQYSAFRAEVPRADDPRTQNNATLMARLERGPQWLVVAGEALSHCVAASGADMFAQLSADRLRQTILLSDCMSPVTGFEAAGQLFLEQARDKGVQVLTAQEAKRQLAVGIMPA